MPNNQTNTEGYISSRSETFGSFKDLQTQGMALSPDNTKDGGDFNDSFADWETGFQSASSQAHAPLVSTEHSKGSMTKGPTTSTTDVAVSAESKSPDLFKDSATAVSAQTSASTFSEHINVEHKVSNKVDSIEPMDEWGEFSATANLSQDDLWPRTSNQLQSTSETVDIETKDEVQCTTSAGDSWGQDKTWSTSNIKAASVKSDDGNDAFDDAFDSWQDFAGSNEAPGVSSSSLTQPGNELAYREYDPTLKTEELQDLEFGSFFNSDSSLGALTEQRGPSESASTNKIEKYTDGKSATQNPWENEQDFTSFSNEESRDLLNLWSQTTNESTPKQASLIKSVDPQDMEFGSFLHSGFFSGALDGEKGLTKASVAKLEDPVSTNSMNKFDNTQHIDDPLEAWKDFANSEEAPRGLPNTWIPSREASTEDAPGVKSVDPVDSEFGSFVHTDSFSGLDKSSTKVNDIMLDSLVSKPSAEFISGNDMDDNDGLFGSLKDSTSLSEVPAGLPNSLTQPGSTSTSSKSAELKNNNHTDDNDDPFGSWNEATSLHEVPEGLRNLSAQTGAKTTLYEQTSGMKMMNLEDMDFGGFLQSDMFSGVSHQENSIKVNDVQLDALVSTSSIKEANNTKNEDDDNDLFGGWQDFIGLNEAQRSSGNLLREPDAGAISYGHTSGAKSLDLHDMGFGSFLYSDSSGTLGHKRSNSEVNSMQDPSISFRMNGMDEKIGAVSKAAEAHENNIYAPNNESTNSNIEMLLAQMPDLSFMLDDKLSIPKKADGSHSNF
ncbi:uncharacterized protein A4U43_C05F25210 [Asparagus officinalis]|uniref:Uncharacterized protein n=2 Tax=Asparagus officinalis TaxID=4686 RepID=A0A5P1EUH9_ASPOF|nr:uncharacterized protein A4U43_C05F25210 [Asparagus officinalis]